MPPVGLPVLYLHGFASGPESRKAQFFGEQLRQLGFSVTVPDLAQGDFERLTITAQLEVIERVSAHRRNILIGSSLGGYLAALYAARHPEVDRLILLAPAFDFYRRWVAQLGPERLAHWRETGVISVFHYAAGREVPLGYQFLDDSIHFKPFPDFSQPALIFHGNEDPVVPVTCSSEFVKAHPNARLIRLESGHELTDVLDAMWLESRRFLLSRRTAAE